MSPDAIVAGLIDADGVAEVLHCDPARISQLDSCGRIPRPIKIGRLKRWAPEEINAWIAARCPRRGEWESMRKDSTSE